MEVFFCGFNGFEQISVHQLSVHRGSVECYHSLNKPVNILRCECDDNAVVCCCTWSEVYLHHHDSTWTKNRQLSSIKPVKLACTWSRVLAVNSNSTLFLFDENDKQSEWKECALEEYVDIEAVDGGERDFYILYDKGKIGKLILTEEQPDTAVIWVIITRIPLQMCIVSLTCGKEHVLILTDTGSVYSFGLGSRGQLGHGSVDEEKEPRLIEALDGIHITLVSSGGWHSMAITATGDLYAWGWNETGQLGLPCPSLRSSQLGTSDELCQSLVAVPEPITVPHSLSVVKVSCGSRHTAVIIDEHRLFTTGWNKYGQLGVGDSQSRDVFTEVDILKPYYVQDAYCSYWNTVIVAKLKPG